MTNLLNNADHFRDLSFIDRLLHYLAPHYFNKNHQLLSQNTSQLHSISPDTTRIFADLCYKILESRKFSHIKKKLIRNALISISVNFFIEIKELEKANKICELVLELNEDFQGVWNTLGYTFTLKENIKWRLKHMKVL